jgi:hypothetical protein
MSTICNFTQLISEDECIGDSLEKFNNNFNNLDTATCTLSSPLATGTTFPRTIQDRFGDLINVKDFGAIGDGFADDTAALQAALNSEKYVYLPPGVYRTTSTLIAKNGSRLIGAGTAGSYGINRDNFTKNTTIIRYTGPFGANTCVLRASSHPIETPTSSSRLENITLENIVLDGNLRAEIGLYSSYSIGPNNNINNITAILTLQDGIKAENTFGGTCANWKAIYNQNRGISINSSIGTQYISPTVAFNGRTGFSTDGNYLPTTVVNIETFNETTATTNGCGLYIKSPQSMVVSNLYCIQNLGVGVYLEPSNFPVTFYGGRIANNGASTSATKSWPIWYQATQAVSGISVFENLQINTSTKPSTIRIDGPAPARPEWNLSLRNVQTFDEVFATHGNYKLINCNTDVQFLSVAPTSSIEHFNTTIKIETGNINNNNTTWTSATGTPDGVISAPKGSLFTRTDGTVRSTLYVKISGTNTSGWRPVSFYRNDDIITGDGSLPATSFL